MKSPVRWPNTRKIFMNINVTGYFNMDIIMDIDGYRYYNGYLMNMNGFQSQLQHYGMGWSQLTTTCGLTKHPWVRSESEAFVEVEVRKLPIWFNLSKCIGNIWTKMKTTGNHVGNLHGCGVQFFYDRDCVKWKLKKCKQKSKSSGRCVATILGTGSCTLKEWGFAAFCS